MLSAIGLVYLFINLLFFYQHILSESSTDIHMLFFLYTKENSTICECQVLATPIFFLLKFDFLYEKQTTRNISYLPLYDDSLLSFFSYAGIVCCSLVERKNCRSRNPSEKLMSLGIDNLEHFQFSIVFSCNFTGLHIKIKCVACVVLCDT